MEKYKRMKQAHIAYIALELGKREADLSLRYPVAETIKAIANECYDINKICKIARMVGMDITLKKGEWHEHNVPVKNLLSQ